MPEVEGDVSGRRWRRNPAPVLSARQKEWLARIAGGQTSGEIAAALSLSPGQSITMSAMTVLGCAHAPPRSPSVWPIRRLGRTWAPIVNQVRQAQHRAAGQQKQAAAERQSPAGQKRQANTLHQAPRKRRQPRAPRRYGPGEPAAAGRPTAPCNRRSPPECARDGTATRSGAARRLPGARRSRPRDATIGLARPRPTLSRLKVADRQGRDPPRSSWAEINQQGRAEHRRGDKRHQGRGHGQNQHHTAERAIVERLEQLGDRQPIAGLHRKTSQQDGKVQGLPSGSVASPDDRGEEDRVAQDWRGGRIGPLPSGGS